MLAIAMVVALAGITQDHDATIRYAVASANRTSDMSRGVLYHVAGRTAHSWRVIAG